MVRFQLLSVLLFVRAVVAQNELRRKKSLTFDFLNGILEVRFKEQPSEWTLRVEEPYNTVTVTVKYQDGALYVNASSTSFKGCRAVTLPMDVAVKPLFGYDNWSINLLNAPFHLQFWAYDVLGFFLDLDSCFYWKNWRFKSPKVAFPSHTVGFTSNYDKAILNAYLNTSEMAYPPYFNGFMDIFKVEYVRMPSSQPSFYIHHVLGFEDLDVLMHITLMANTSKYSVFIKETAFHQNWKILSNKTLLVESEPTHLKWGGIVHLSSSELSLLWKESNVTARLSYPGLVVLERMQKHKSAKISSIQMLTNDQNLFAHFLSSICPLPTIELYPNMGQIEAYQIRSSEQGNLGKASAILKYLNRGYPNRNCHIFCSVEASRAQRNYIEIDYIIPRNLVGDIVILLIRASPTISCQEYINADLQGGKLYLNQTLLKEISLEEAQRNKVIFAVTHSSNYSEGLVTLRYESGPTNSIRICGFRFYGNVWTIQPEPFVMRPYYTSLGPSYDNLIGDIVFAKTFTEATHLSKSFEFAFKVNVFNPHDINGENRTEECCRTEGTTHISNSPPNATETPCTTQYNYCCKKNLATCQEDMKTWNFSLTSPLSTSIVISISLTFLRYENVENKEIPVYAHAPNDFHPRLRTLGNDICLHLVSISPLGHETFLCPGGKQAYLTKIHNSLCFFSKVCEDDESHFQGCGCPYIEYNAQHQNFKTNICIPKQRINVEIDGQILKYVALRSYQLFNGIVDCEDGSDEANPSTLAVNNTLTTTQSNRFQCADGTFINSDKRCNYLPDCTQSFTYDQRGTRVYLLEDEANCNHTFGLDCSHELPFQTQRVWIPPRHFCNNFTICSYFQDESPEIRCRSDLHSFSCKDTNLNKVTLVPSQLCDFSNQYCHDNSDKFNCTDISTPKQITCVVEGYLTKIPGVMECDGRRQCDSGEDENCIILYPSCKLHIRFMKLSVRELGDALQSYPQCVYTRQVQNIYNTLHGTARVRCPGSSVSYYIVANHLCDGVQDCPVNTEEATCSKASNYVNILPSAHVEETTFRTTAFMEGCIPGLSLNTTCKKHELVIERGVTYRIWVSQHRYDCTQVEGPVVAALGCLGMCSTGTPTCKLQLHACERSNGTVYSLSGKKVASLSWNTAGNIRGKFQCENGNCIEYERLCDHADDCGDKSDERGCPNKFNCTHSEFIPKAFVCDGKYQCSNKIDECSTSCESGLRSTLLRGWQIYTSFIIGSSAVAINVVSLVSMALQFFSKKGRNLRKCNTMNEILVLLISVGDLFVGLYMLMLFSYHYVTKDEWCFIRYEWKGLQICSILGFISTFGSTLSLSSMTVLSLLRAVSVSRMTPTVSGGPINILKTSTVAFIVITCSGLLSTLPLLPSLGEYFDNGILIQKSVLFPNVYYDSKLEVARHLQPWYENTLTNIAEFSWTDIKERVSTIFIESKEQQPRVVGFYGSDDVCLFKYFATFDNPQWEFIMFVLLQNITCFIIITLAYLQIMHRTRMSARAVGNTTTNPTTVKLQQKIALIILTDFMTWIPFMVLALLHFNHVLDKHDTEFIYPFCSLILLPINSVINPLIYNSDKLTKIYGSMNKSLRSTRDNSIHTNTRFTSM